MPSHSLSKALSKALKKSAAALLPSSRLAHISKANALPKITARKAEFLLIAVLHLQLACRAPFVRVGDDLLVDDGGDLQRTISTRFGHSDCL